MKYLFMECFYVPSCRGHNNINVFEDIQVILHQSSPATSSLYKQAAEIVSFICTSTLLQIRLLYTVTDSWPIFWLHHVVLWVDHK